MTNLGILYEHGRGVPQNYTLARQWYKKPPPQATAMR